MVYKRREVKEIASRCLERTQAMGEPPVALAQMRGPAFFGVLGVGHR